tara:strand:- start:243 stop:464 length:222 start_codon:yes stop_codon:yes gene_type:complete
MPKVGNKHFAYTKEGEKAAKEKSAKTGQPVKNMKKYMAGGMLNLSSGPGYPKPKTEQVRGAGAATRGKNFRKV